ncbi:exodeoxyribonuclease III [Methanobrevibacter sp.]|uniref:exodeoxyribonuclease III n=1 Tax=Methanobrevibacter sp. TaxID=66852 RepID=UPI0038661F5B
MKIISWNVNGINPTYENGYLNQLIEEETPDIICIQEVKTAEIPELEGYDLYGFPSSETSNHYGTAVYTKIEPISHKFGLGDKEFDSEGRVIRLEFENFNLYNVYVPSGAKDKEKLKRKYRFYDEFTEYFKKSNKPAIICGDFNRIAGEIDAKRPELMKNKSGFMPEEQEWFKEILTKYVDAFRKFNQDGDNFTWWSNRKGFREENKGLRLDYFLVSKTFENKLTDSYILKDQLGSDHAPIVLELNSCPVCGNANNKDDEYCYICGIKLIESDEEETISEDKLEIPKDKIILLDLNYTLIANSKEIKNYPLDKKIKSQQYETDLIDLIKDNYVILITASPYNRSYKILRDIKEKTGFEPNESYWNFGRQPPVLKKYWMENEVIPMHGDNPDKYLAIESNPTTRRMYDKLGIEARPKSDFI